MNVEVVDLAVAVGLGLRFDEASTCRQGFRGFGGLGFRGFGGV